MQTQPEAGFGIADARRILGEVFAPWVQDLNLAVERIEHIQPADAPDWQPGALLRMSREGAARPVSTKLKCRAEISASPARSSWLIRRRCRHSRK